MIAETSRSPVRPPVSPSPHSSSCQGVTLLFGGGVQSTESHLGDAETKNPSQEEVPAEPEPPNPFCQLTDQELEDYKREVERKKLGLHGTSWGDRVHPRAPLWGL